MPSVKLYDMKANEVGTLTLNDALFDAEYNEPVIHQAVVTRLANERQGTKSTLTRSEVRGGGAKPWRQKGTGRARQGSIRSPQWVKGGVVFAPKSRDFSKKMNEKAKRVALFSALSEKVRTNQVVFIDEIKFQSPKTKEMAAFLKAFGIAGTALIVVDEKDENLLRASANICELGALNVNQLSTYEVVKYAKLIISKKAVEKIEEVYGE